MCKYTEFEFMEESTNQHKLHEIVLRQMYIPNREDPIYLARM